MEGFCVKYWFDGKFVEAWKRKIFAELCGLSRHRQSFYGSWLHQLTCWSVDYDLAYDHSVQKHFLIVK